MIEFEQLIHLVAFYEHQTLSEAAKHLHISQPVLTRSMQKLEESHYFNVQKIEYRLMRLDLWLLNMPKELLMTQPI